MHEMVNIVKFHHLTKNASHAEVFYAMEYYQSFNILLHENVP